MMATKEQELRALAKIKKIVEDLGENSYIAMAFEGCFEIAEDNIGNDFGCSMKQRAESAERKLSKLEMENKDLRITIENLKSQYANVESKTLTVEEAGAIKSILSEANRNAEDLSHSSTQKIVELADNPNCAEFRQAVMHNRQSKKRMEQCSTLIGRLLETMK